MHRLLCATIVAAALNLALASAANADLASGVELFDAGQIEQAHPIFAAAVQNDPTNAEALFYLGQVELMTGEFDAAVQHLKLAVDIDDQKSVYYQKLGEAYGSKAGEANFIRQVGLAGNVKDAFERAVELDPENTDARLGLVTYYVNAVSITGGYYVNLNEEDVVAAALNLALASAANADLASGVELFDAGQIEQAHPIFAAAVQNDPTNAEALFYLGQVELMTGEFDAAVQHLKLAVDIDDQKSVYYQKLGEAYGSKAGEANFIRQVGLAGNIKDAFERAVELDPENIDARLGLVTYYVNAVSITGGASKKARLISGNKPISMIRNRFITRN